MGERTGGPLGLHLHLDARLAPGFPQSGLPLRLVLPGPIGTPSWHVAAGAHRTKERTADDPARPLSALEKFKKALIARQIAARPTSTAIFGLENNQLRILPFARPQQMRIDVAPLATAMWNELLEEYQTRANPTKGDSVGVASAYRSAKQDAKAWEKAFPKYYKATLEARLATHDEFGKKAVEIIFHHMNGKKAPPGFSGHTHGIAMDLTTTEKGQLWEVNSNYGHQVGWQKTWLYRWLVANAAKHKFYQLKTETWHWEYHENDPPRQCWGGSVTHRPVAKPK